MKQKHKKNQRNKQRKNAILFGVLGIFIMGIVGTGWWYMEQNYSVYQKKLIARNTQVLTISAGELPDSFVLQRMTALQSIDLTGRKDISCEQADELLRILPAGCRLLWNVPLTNGYFQSDATELVLPGCTEEDIARLRYFEGLARVDATGAVCYEALAALNDTVEVTYTFPLGDGVLTNHDTTFTATGVGSMAGLDAVLPFFSQLKEADLRDGTVPNEEMRSFIKAHPELTIHWTVHYGDAAFDAEAETIDLTGITFADEEEATQFLSCFFSLKEVDLRNTGLYNEDAVLAANVLGEIPILYDVRVFGQVYSMETEELDLSGMDKDGVVLEELQVVLKHLQKLTMVRFPEGMNTDNLDGLVNAYPQVHFIRPVTVFGNTVSNDIQKMDISGEKVSLEEAKNACRLLPFLHELVMCNCGLTNQEMDELIETFPEVKFVWEIAVGSHVLRTDAVGFSTKNPSKYTNPNASDKYNASVKSTIRLKEGDIDSLKYCTDLVALDLGHNFLTNKDLQVIAGLEHLQILILADNKITDITPLSSLKELQYIELFMNNIPDMSPLSGLTELTDINVCKTGLKSLQPFENLPKLQRFWYSMNQDTLSADRCKKTAQLLSSKYGTVCNYSVKSATEGGWRESDRYTWMRSYFKD